MTPFLSLLLRAAIIVVGAIYLAEAVKASESGHDTDMRSPRGDVIAAYRDAVAILKNGSVTSGDEDRIKALHADFDKAKTTAIISSTMLRKVDRFWSGLETEFLPAVKNADKTKVEETFARLTDRYTDCCKPPVAVTEAAADRLPFRDNEAGSGSRETDVAKPPQMAPAVPISMVLLGLLSAFVVTFLVYFRFIRTRANPAGVELRHGVKPLFLRDVETKVHTNLDDKLAALRSSLVAHGTPRRENDKLYFGDYLVNGNNEIVDQIKERFDCYATIFLNDRRIATNVLQADGSRALDTPLVKGAAYDAIFNHAKAFAGDVTLFGKPILGLYEPIFCGAEVIGIIFVGE